MKKLKLTHRLYVGYTGVVGRYQFVDGISVEEIPHNERSRIASVIDCVEIEEDGNEGSNPSPAVSVFENQKLRSTLKSLPRQTEEEKAMENASIALNVQKVKPLFTSEALDAIAAKGGIAALREVAAHWEVKSKSIPVLMQMIIDKQSAYVSDMRAALIEKGIPEEEIGKLLALSGEEGVEASVPQSEPERERGVKATTPVAPPAPEPEQERERNSVAEAAMTGDMAAALNEGETKSEGSE